MGIGAGNIRGRRGLLYLKPSKLRPLTRVWLKAFFIYVFCAKLQATYYLGTSNEYTSFQTRREYIPVGSSKRSLFLTV